MNTSKWRRRWTRVALRAMLASAAIAFPASAQTRLEVRLDSAPPVLFTAAELALLPRMDVQVEDHGKQAKFAGVRLADVLRTAKVPIDSVRGQRATLIMLVTAADGYRAAFTLAELAPDLGGRDVLVADTRDGAPLSPEDGPLRLIVPGDKRATRWVRQVRSLAIFQIP